MRMNMEEVNWMIEEVIGSFEHSSLSFDELKYVLGVVERKTRKIDRLRCRVQIFSPKKKEFVQCHFTAEGQTNICRAHRELKASGPSKRSGRPNSQHARYPEA